MKKLTIFTPTYNRAYILNQCYTALKKQTNKDFVWLIVDDGSSDNTKEVVKEFQAEDIIEIKYIYQKNGGKYKAINTAVINCETELFSFLDSDDYYKEDTVQTFFDCIEEVKTQNVAGVVGRRCNPNGDIVGNRVEIQKGIINFDKLVLKYNFSGDTCRMYKTDILKRFLYPEIQDKFIPENVMLSKIDLEYDIYFINKALSVSEYLEDGYTKSYKKLLSKNPKGYLLSLNQSIVARQGIKNKLKAILSYITWGKRHKEKQLFIKCNNKLLYIIAILPAYLLLLLGMPSWHTPNRGVVNKLRIWSKLLKHYIVSFNGSKAKILDSQETVDLALKENKSIIRMGDGEFNLLEGKDIHYQVASKKLIDDFKGLICAYQNNQEESRYILCVPKFFMQCSGLKLAKKRVWLSSWAYSRYKFIKDFNQDIIYGDAFLFAQGNENIYKQLWEGKYENCIFVHNDRKFSNDFESKYKINTHFIEVPNQNAYAYLEEIYVNIIDTLNDLKKESTIVLISAGPAAKILVAKLCDKVKVIDTGHCWDQPLNKGRL